MHTHLPRDVGGDDVSVLELDLEHCVRERFEDDTVEFYCCLLRHILFARLKLSVYQDFLDKVKRREDIGLAIADSDAVLEVG